VPSTSAWSLFAEGNERRQPPNGCLVNNRRPITTINLGGEGEVWGVVNQQRPATLAATWASSVAGSTLEELAAQGNDFLICENIRLPIHDDSVDLVITNSVPIDRAFLGQPGVQSSEIRRILAPGGQWVHDGKVRFTKP
jgi:hypothetical protein